MIRAPVDSTAFAELLRPYEVDDFLSNHHLHAPLLIEGEQTKFSNLFAWQSLNELLSLQRLDLSRVRLEMPGASARDLEFAERAFNLRGEPISRIDSERLYEQLRQGFTLVVDTVDEVNAAVRSLAEDMSSIFSARAAVNLYAAFGKTPGFNPHWDSRDVFAVQVEGRKLWRIWRPTRANPLYRDMHDPEAVPHELYWEGIVDKGSVLYVPRGWWHEVTGLDEPTLHLTVGTSPVTGIEYLQWLVDQLRDDGLMRAELPRFADDVPLAEHHRTISDCVQSALSSFSLEQYLHSVAASTRVRPRIRLPEGAQAASAVAFENETVVRAAARPLVSQAGPLEVVQIMANQRVITVAASAKPLIDLLFRSDGGSVTVAELKACLNGSARGVDPLLHSLLVNGLVQIDS